MGLTNAERQARWRERQQQRANQRIAELEQRIAELNGRVPLHNDAPVAALKTELAQAKARITELERELTNERERREAVEPKAAPRDNKDDRIAELEEEIHGLRLHIRFGPKRRAAEPKAEKPPLPPDEERDRIIKGLRTRVRNVTQELRHFQLYHEDAMAKQGLMSRETRTAIDKVLHPDGSPTEADKGRAAKGWNVWKNDNDKARRRAR